MRPLTRLVTGVALCAVVGVTVLGTAAADTVPVTVSVSSGTRTLHLSDPS